jgi:hypothetical protein
MKIDVAEVLQRLRDGGIHFSISEDESVPECRFTCYMPSNNQYSLGIFFNRETYVGAVEEVGKTAFEEFPNSEFAKWWRGESQ